MEPEGLSSKVVLEKLAKTHALDKHYDSGRILCSMCTKPHPIAEKAYQMFFESNLGDSGLFPGSVQLEKEVINQLGTLLQNKNAAGFIVSGGTEANLLALWAARTKAKTGKPEVVMPESAHFSFTKICNLLNLKPVFVRLDSDFRVNPSEFEDCINENTVALVGTAGTAELGAIDPIDELSKIALKQGVFLHVDAAFGGLVIPFLSEPKPLFDFGLEGVKSITVDPHKMGVAAIPAGGILFKDAETLEYIKTKTPYLTDKEQYTLLGTRTGAAVASTWAVFNGLGVNGYRKIVAECMENTRMLAEGIRKAGFELVTEPTLNLVTFQGHNTQSLAEKLWKRGWYVSYVPRYNCIRIVVMPHVKRVHTDAFLKDLVEIEKL